MPAKTGVHPPQSAAPPYKTSDLRAAARAIVKSLTRDPAAVLDRAVKEHAAGERFLAYELLRTCPAAVCGSTSARVQQLARRISDWGSVDCYGSFVSGVAWREGVLPDSVIHRWTKSPDRWFRRAALVSTVPLNLPARGATNPLGEPEKTLAVCERLIDDRDDMVVKALSWALRVLAMKNPKSVRQFIKQHESRLAPRVKREVNNKLKTGLKNPKI